MDIWETVLGFMDSQVLLTAEEMGVFDRLDACPATASDVAAATGLPESTAERLLTALCALGAVQKDADGRHVNSPEVAEKLVRGKPGYIGAMFQHVRDVLYPVWGHFREALYQNRAPWHLAFDGDTAPTEDMYSDLETLRAFMEGMHAITYGAALEFADGASELSQVRTIVDIGGASGAFLIALAQRHPAMRGILYDLPQVRPISEDVVRQHGLGKRIQFHGGNFFHDPLPDGADAYALGYVLHDWETKAGSMLLQKVADACRPGTLLIIGEYLLNDDRTGPLFVARSDLNMLVSARGRERTQQEYTEWVRHFGFQMERVYWTSAGKCFMVSRKQ